MGSPRSVRNFSPVKTAGVWNPAQVSKNGIKIADVREFDLTEYRHRERLDAKMEAYINSHKIGGLGQAMDPSNLKNGSPRKAPPKNPSPTMPLDQFGQVSHKQLLKEITSNYGLLPPNPPRPNIEPIDLLEGGMQVMGTSMYEQIAKKPLPVPTRTATNEIRINETNINLAPHNPTTSKPEATILPHLKNTNTSFYTKTHTGTHNPRKIHSEKINLMYLHKKNKN